MHVFEGDLLDPVPEPVQVVVANLPYLPEGEHDDAYDDEPADAIYAPGDGLGPLRQLLNICEAGKLAMPGFALVQYRGEVHEADCQHLPELREELASTRRTPRRLAAMDSGREVVFVDGVRTAFGRAGEQGVFWRTRADDMGVKAVRELLRRNPQLDPERIGDVILAATAQVGDQGLTLGRDVALLAGIPQSVPGFAIDRMCAGALTAVTAGAGEIALGACDVVVAGGIEHMGHHPMGADVDFNPRFVAERLVDTSAVTMGATAENLHDAFPQLTKEDADRFAVQSQQRATAAWVTAATA